MRELTAMRFKNYVWPHNPKRYSIHYERHMQAVTVPGGQDFVACSGMGRRVMRGQGEFAGKGAYSEFKRLAAVFYEPTAGTLVHPVWQAAQVYFAELKLEQEPRADYVRYSFVFWEDLYPYESGLTVSEAARTAETAQAAGGSGAGAANGGGQSYTVAKGDTMSGIAQRFGMSLEELVAKNPQVKNIHLIYVGQALTVG